MPPIKKHLKIWLWPEDSIVLGIPTEHNIFMMKAMAVTFLKKIKYGAKFQESENSSQVSLFGDASEVQIPEPEVPPCEEWGTMEKLRRKRSGWYLYFWSPAG